MVNSYYIMDALHNNSGFFSNYLCVLGYLIMCETDTPIGFEVFFEKGLYFDKNMGPNWWEYYFEPIRFGNKDGAIINHIDGAGRHWADDGFFQKVKYSEMIKKYVKVRPHIQNKIDQFVARNFSNNYIIGIHYRGTDKNSSVSFDEVKNKILEISKDKQNYKIFVATDVNAFINYMIKQFGDKVSYTNAIRSFNGDAIHHHASGWDVPVKNNRYTLGEEAVIDCYLLSKTNIMIKTESNLNDVASLISPSLPVIHLGPHNRL